MDVIVLVSFERDGVPRIDAASSRALDAAFRFAEDAGLGTVAAGIGGMDCSEALSMSGAERNVLLSDPVFEKSDIGALARIFAASMGGREWIVFCGNKILTGYLSGMLGMPHLCSLAAIGNGSVGVFLNDGFSYRRRIDGPCCVHVLDSVGWPPRTSRRKAAEAFGSDDLGLGRLSVGAEGSLTVSDPVADDSPAKRGGRAALLGFMGACR